MSCYCVSVCNFVLAVSLLVFCLLFRCLFVCCWFVGLSRWFVSLFVYVFWFRCVWFDALIRFGASFFVCCFCSMCWFDVSRLVSWLLYCSFAVFMCFVSLFRLDDVVRLVVSLLYSLSCIALVCVWLRVWCVLFRLFVSLFRYLVRCVGSCLFRCCCFDLYVVCVIVSFVWFMRLFRVLFHWLLWYRSFVVCVVFWFGVYVRLLFVLFRCRFCVSFRCCVSFV